jgi:hypothetical protein
MRCDLCEPGREYSTRTWVCSATAFTTLGTYVFGEAVCIPSYGQTGLIAFLGGSASATRTMWVDNGDLFVPFDNLTFFDPAAKKWYSQQATGTIPDPRDRFCAFGVQGPNKTSEM